MIARYIFDVGVKNVVRKRACRIGEATRSNDRALS